MGHLLTCSQLSVLFLNVEEFLLEFQRFVSPDRAWTGSELPRGSGWVRSLFCFGENRYFKRFELNSRIALGFTNEPLVSLLLKWTGVSPILSPSSRARIMISASANQSSDWRCSSSYFSRRMILGFELTSRTLNPKSRLKIPLYTAEIKRRYKPSSRITRYVFARSRSSSSHFRRQAIIDSGGNCPSPSITPIYVPRAASRPIRMSHPIIPCLGRITVRMFAELSASFLTTSGVSSSLPST